MSLLEAHGLCKCYGGIAAADDVTLAVDAGEIVALIGPNGAGKTTCFNILGGQIRADAGRVRFDGTEVAGWSPGRLWRRGLARTFQITATMASLSVRENVQLTLLSRHRLMRRLFGNGGRQFRSEAEAELERVGMAAQADRLCGHLAYGDLKRVELAVALAGGPRLLLMDEPTAGLAPAERFEIMALVARIARESGLGVLFTEHDVDLVFAHADRIVVLDRGRVIADAAPDLVRADPRVQASYLGADAIDAQVPP